MSEAVNDDRAAQATVEINEALRALGMNGDRFTRMVSEAQRGQTGDTYGLIVCKRVNADAMRDLFKAVRLLAGEPDAGCPGPSCLGCPGCQEIGAGPLGFVPGDTCPECNEVVRVVLVELGGPTTGPTGLDKELACGCDDRPHAAGCAYRRGSAFECDCDKSTEAQGGHHDN